MTDYEAKSLTKRDLRNKVLGLGNHSIESMVPHGGAEISIDEIRTDKNAYINTNSLLPWTMDTSMLPPVTKTTQFKSFQPY